MAPSVELSHATFARLQTHAVPLVDTIESVINRMIDAYEQKGSERPSGGDDGQGGQKVRAFDPYTPPDLTHAKILGVTFCGQPLGRSGDNWNSLLNAAVRVARERAKTPDGFRRLMVVNHVEGRKQNEGYRHFPELGVSVQGQDANGAWRAVSHIARHLGCQVLVKFAWREKPGAAFPGTVGQFTIAGT